MQIKDLKQRVQQEDTQYYYLTGEDFTKNFTKWKIKMKLFSAIMLVECAQG